MELTAEIVESAVYEGRSHTGKGGRKRWTRHEIWDDRLPGFGLRITSTNRKSWVVSYSARGRKSTKTLGKAADLSLEEARARAAELLGADENEEPSPRAKKKPTTRAKKKPTTRAKKQPATRTKNKPAARAKRKPAARGKKKPAARAREEPSPRADEEVRGVETVAQLADLYLERHLKNEVPSWFGDQRLIRTHIVPALGRLPIAQVTRGDRSSLAVRVGQKFPADARRLRELLDGMFACAEQHDLAAGPSTKLAASSRGAAPAEGPGDGSEPPAEATPPISPAEPKKDLASAETQRQGLAERLDEVSAAGVEMLSQINQQTTRQRELEAELARSQRELERVLAEARKAPDPEKTKKQLATLQTSVGQLVDSLKIAEQERDEAAGEVARIERRARKQSAQMTELRLERDQLESRLRELEQDSAHGPAPRSRPAFWLATGAAAGVLATLLLYRILASAAAPPPASRTSAPAQPRPSAVAQAPLAEPAEPSAPPAAVAPSGGQASPGQAETEPAPDPALADAAVRAWASAWSEQRVDDYLAAYSSAFAPGDGTPHDEWAALRRQRILAPASIQVAVGELSRTRLATDRIRVSFQQSYWTESYSDEVVKTLELVWEDGGWKIATEVAD